MFGHLFPLVNTIRYPLYRHSLLQPLSLIRLENMISLVSFAIHYDAVQERYHRNKHHKEFTEDFNGSFHEKAL